MVILEWVILGWPWWEGDVYGEIKRPEEKKRAERKPGENVSRKEWTGCAEGTLAGRWRTRVTGWGTRLEASMTKPHGTLTAPVRDLGLQQGSTVLWANTHFTMTTHDAGGEGMDRRMSKARVEAGGLDRRKWTWPDCCGEMRTADGIRIWSIPLSLLNHMNPQKPVSACFILQILNQPSWMLVLTLRC